MRLVFWLVVVPLAVAVAFFAVANRDEVALEFLGYAVVTPKFLLILGAVLLGLVIGGTSTWFGQHHWRKQARQLHRRVRHLEGEIETFRGRSTTGTPVPPPPSPPPGTA